MTWETVQLDKIAWLNRPADSLTEAATFLGMADLSEDGTTTSGMRIGPGDLKPGYTPFRDRDLLVAKITPCFENGKIGQAVLPTKLGWGSTEFYVVRPDTEIVHDRYLLHFLRSPEVRARGSLRMTGSAGQRRVPVSFLRSLGVPLPPLPEQRRIAAILDETDALRRAQAHCLTTIGDLANSVFRAFEEELDGAEVTPLGALADVSSGITKGRKPPAGALRLVDYMTVANVQDKRLELATIKQIEVSPAEIDRYRLLPGDLLLTEGGDPDKLGRGVVWNSELDLSIHQNHVFRVRLKNDDHSSTWLNWEVGSDYGKKYFLRAAKQTTGIATINSTQLKNFPVRIPARGRADEFVRSIMAITAQRSKAVERSRHLDTLFASLQHRAFRGEL